MVQFSPCQCPAGKIARIERSAWMRTVFPSRVLYHCGSCGARFLATPSHQAELGLRAQAERQQGRSSAA